MYIAYHNIYVTRIFGLHEQIKTPLENRYSGSLGRVKNIVTNSATRSHISDSYEFIYTMCNGEILTVYTPRGQIIFEINGIDNQNYYYTTLWVTIHPNTPYTMTN